MKGSTYLRQPIIERLPGLLEQLRRGEILIPRFQRPFVWTNEQRLLLLNSVYEGIPIGSILVWRTKKHEVPSYDHIGAQPLGGLPQGGDSIKQYLLDGNQRMITLYTALGQGRAAGEFSDEESIEPLIRPIYFDLAEQVFELRPLDGVISPAWLPLTLLLDPYRLYNFQKKLLREGLDRNLANRAESLAGIFKDCSIPVIPIVSEDFESATESFMRVNLSGTKMSEVHMLNALTWGPKFDLSERLEEVRNELGEVGWESFEDELILRSLKAMLDLDLYHSEPKAVRDKMKDHPEILASVTGCLKLTAQFLADHCQVYGPGVLPYSLQAVLLTDAIHTATEDGKRELSASAKEALRNWFWLTTYTEYFGGISASRVRRAHEHLRRVVTNNADPCPEDLPRKVTAPGRFDFRAARSRALCLRLAELQPRDSNGNVQSSLQLLADHGKDAAPLLVPSSRISARWMAEGVENRVLVDPKDLRTLRSVFDSPLAPGAQEILRSHAVDEHAASALSKGGLDEFFGLRRNRIRELERRFVEDLGLEYEDEGAESPS